MSPGNLLVMHILRPGLNYTESKPRDLKRDWESREYDPEGQWDLTIGFHRTGGKSWRAQTKPCPHQDPEQKSSDPTED